MPFFSFDSVANGIPRILTTARHHSTVKIMAVSDSTSIGPSSTAIPTLPNNVYIFSPTDPDAATSLLNGRMFTRLTTGAQTEPSELSLALRNGLGVEACETFCLSHRNAVLIFDSNGDGEELQNSHHEHFRLVCLALRDADIGLEVSKCIFDASNILGAGFQLDRMSRGSVLVIDLMGDESDEDSDLDDTNPLQSFTTSGNAGAETH